MGVMRNRSLFATRSSGPGRFHPGPANEGTVVFAAYGRDSNLRDEENLGAQLALHPEPAKGSTQAMTNLVSTG
jgi:hypothetical protein